MSNYPPNINWLGPVNWLHPLNRGLIAWWLVVPGLTGGPTWIDLVRPSNGNHGVLTNMDLSAVWSGDSPPGGWASLDFDGSDDYVDAGNDVSLDVAEFTICAGFKADSYTGTANRNNWIVGKDVSGARSYDFGVRNVNQDILLDCQINGSTPFGRGSTILTVDGLWHLGLVSYDGADLLYQLDGVDDGGGATSTDPDVTTTNVRIGAREFIGNTEEWDGHLDSVRVWNRGLTSEEGAQYHLLSKQGYPGLLNRIDRRLFVAAAVGLSIPIAAYHYNHHLRSMT